MRGVVADRARADRGAHRVRRRGDDERLRADAELGGGRRTDRADDGRARPQLGQPRLVDPGELQQARVVVHVQRVARVGDPVQRRGVVGRGADAGELQVEPVHRLEEGGRGRPDLRPLVAQELQMGEAVATRQRRRPSRAPDPAGDPLRGIPLDAHAACSGARDAPRLLGSPAVEPGQRRSQGLAGGVHRDRPGPLPRDRDRRHALELARMLSGDAPSTRHDRGPPVLRPLLGCTAGAEQHLHRLERGSHDGPARPTSATSARPSQGRSRARAARAADYGETRTPGPSGAVSVRAPGPRHTAITQPPKAHDSTHVRERSRASHPPASKRFSTTGSGRSWRPRTTAGFILGDRRIWSINSTLTGGGVAEMLQSLVAYARGASVDARWSVIDG